MPRLDVTICRSVGESAASALATVRRYIPLLVCIVWAAACGSNPSSPSTATSVATTSIGGPSTGGPVQALHYVGTYALPAPLPALPLDLSLYFTLPGGALSPRAIFPRAIYNVFGGYNTGPTGFSGTISGTLDGALGNGTFNGIVTATLASGCVARRNYSGPLTSQSLNWTPGAQIETCGGASPLVSAINPPAAPAGSPATTSISTSTTSSSTTSSSSTTVTTTTIPTTTVPTTVPTTTTSVRTTTSATTTVLGSAPR